MSTTISTTARCNAWGSNGWNARAVHFLTKQEREIIRAGGLVMIDNCPEFRGTKLRRVVLLNGRFYARMPANA